MKISKPMRQLLTLIFIAVFAFSCTSKEDNTSKNSGDNYGMELKGDGSFTVTGTIENASGKNIYLQTFPLFTGGRNQEVNVQDTAVIGQDGSFTLEGEVNHKTIGMLALDNAHTAYLVLDGSDISFQASFNDFSNHQIEGSPESYLFSQFFELLSSQISAIQNVRKDMQRARQQGAGPEQMKELNEQEFQAMDDYFNFIKNYVDTTSSPLLAMFATGILEPSVYQDYYQQVLDENQPIASNSPYYSRLEKRISGGEGMVGKEAPEIRLPNPGGDTMALSDLRGNYVLLDFWAAWCKPCRRENPNVVRLYNEYKDENFTIFSVSLDRRKSDWTQAIEADNLMWENHVSELAFWNTQAIKPYGVNSIPATFLIGPDGKIIAEGLRGFTLEKKLQQLFGE